MQHLLWKSRHPFEARHEKCAAALVAIAEELAAEGPTAGPEAREFLRQFEACAELEPLAFTTAWRDPTAYAWTLGTFHLLAALRLAGEPEDRARALEYAGADGDAGAALVAHLERFARFALAAHAVAGRDLALERPLVASPPLALPGTRLSLHAAGPVEIDGLAKGRLRGRVAGTPFELDLAEPGPAGPVTLTSCPLIDEAGCELRLQAEAFHDLPGFPEFEVVAAAGDAFQREHRDALAEAVGLVARHDAGAFAQLRDELGVVGLKPPEAGDFANQSHSGLPGAAVVSFCAEPYDLAETLVHELHHDRLFALEEREAFLADEAPQASFYSPWRADPRPLLGVFHAFYVYVAVSRFWLGVDAAEVEPRIADYARSRLALVGLQLRLAEHQLAAHASLGGFGRECFEGIAEAARELDRTCRERGIAADAPSRRCTREGPIVAETDASGAPLSCRADVRRHVEAHAPADQREDLLAVLEAAPA